MAAEPQRKTNKVNFDKQDIVQLYPYKYNAKAAKWQLSAFDALIKQAQNAAASLSENDNSNEQKGNDEQEKPQKESLVVMSFNVWFGQYQVAERQKCLVQILQEMKPDIFCFQEVTEEWMKSFVKIDFIQSNYALTDMEQDLSTIIPYGVFIGVNVEKFNVLDLKISTLQSFMARKLLSIHLQLKTSGDKFWINTVHLESKNSTDRRIRQLLTIFDKYMVRMKQLEDMNATVMLMGDFNFRDNTDGNTLSIEGDVFKENEYLKEDLFIDCWKQYASDHNLNVHSGWTRRVGYRYDRILMNTVSRWNVKDFKIIGDAEKKMPSDHKGVVVYLN